MAWWYIFVAWRKRFKLKVVLELLHALSNRRYVALWQDRSGVNQELGGREETRLCFSGTCLSRSLASVLFYARTSSSKSAGGWDISGSSIRSWINASMSMVLTWQIERKTDWRGVVICLRYESIGKWSDGATGRTVRSVTRVESEGTITRSSVLWSLWVGSRYRYKLHEIKSVQDWITPNSAGICYFIYMNVKITCYWKAVRRSSSNNSRAEVLKLAHDVHGGHNSFRKSRDRIRLSFHWPTLKTNLLRHLQCCLECQTRTRITYLDGVTIHPYLVLNWLSHTVYDVKLHPHRVMSRGRR